MKSAALSFAARRSSPFEGFLLRKSAQVVAIWNPRFIFAIWNPCKRFQLLGRLIGEVPEKWETVFCANRILILITVHFQLYTSSPTIFKRFFYEFWIKRFQIVDLSNISHQVRMQLLLYHKMLFWLVKFADSGKVKSCKRWNLRNTVSFYSSNAYIVFLNYNIMWVNNND